MADRRADLFATGRPQAVLFDWDNTLVDTWPVIYAALNATFAAFGLPEWTLAETRARVRRSMRDSFPELFGARWEEAGVVFYEHFGRIHLAHLRAQPGAGAMLERLHAAGLWLGVVSNKKGDVLRREAAHLGWERLFGRLVGALDAPEDKPSPVPVALALQASGVADRGRVWFVGDTDVDLECAVRAGCVPVLIRDVAPQTGEFATYPPEWHCLDCTSLCSRILNL